MTSGLRLGILGPLEAAADGQRLDLGGPKQRELIAMLVLHLDKVVTTGRLVEALWGPQPPAAAEVTLRTHVSHLRRRLTRRGRAGHRAARVPAAAGPRAGRRVSSTLFVADDVVYLRGTNDKLYRMNIDGTGGKWLGGCYASSAPFVTGDVVYFQTSDIVNVQNQFRLWMINLT